MYEVTTDGTVIPERLFLWHVSLQHLIMAKVLLYPKHSVTLSRSIKRKKRFSGNCMLPRALQRPCLAPLSVSQGCALFSPLALLLSTRRPGALGSLGILLLGILCRRTRKSSAGGRFESCSSGLQELSSLPPVPKGKKWNLPYSRFS